MAYRDLRRTLIKLGLGAASVGLLGPNTARTQEGSGPIRPVMSFPSPNIVLRDARHKEQKSGVQLQGGQMTIQSGVGTPSVINALSFSSDGSVLVAAKDFGRVVIWNVAERKFLRAIETDQGIVNALAVSPDGKTVATSGNKGENEVKIWNGDDGKLLWTFKNSDAPITSLFFDGAGKRLLISTNASIVLVIDIAEQKQVAKLTDVNAVDMTTDGKSLVTSDEKEFAVWSPPAWTKSQAVPKWHEYSMLLTANTSQDLLAVYERKSIKIARASTSSIVRERNDLVSKNFTWRPTFAAFGENGTVLYLSLEDRLQIISTKAYDACRSGVMYSGAAALSPDGRWFAGAKDDSIMSNQRTDGVWVWNTADLLKKCDFETSTNTK